MHIYCLGSSHTTSPISLREKLAYSEEDALSALALLSGNDHFQHICEMVIVSTCNRTELYFTAEAQAPAFSSAEEFLSETRGVALADFHDHLYRYLDEAVFDHLSRVATGLDSLVLGEPQILGQVTRGLEISLAAGACGSVLSTLFRAAIHAGKRARAETAISRNPASVSSLAAALAAKEVNDLPAAQVMVVGAGEMAELVVESLRKRGASQIVVVNRTMKPARLLANRWQARADTFKHMDGWLRKADILISSTSASQPIISSARLERIMRQRCGRRMIVIDIAVPRDIEPSAGQIAGVSLFDIDTLEDQVAGLLAGRNAEIPKVESILKDEKHQFMQYLNGLEVLPLISGLRMQAENIRHHELERTFRYLPELTKPQRERIDAMTRALVKKLLASPTETLRSTAQRPQAAQFASVARMLFDLPDEIGLYAIPNDKQQDASDIDIKRETA